MKSIYNYNNYSLMNSFGYMPTLLRPTRVTISSLSIIDQIQTNDNQEVLSPGIIRSIRSDHFPIIVCSRCFFGDPDNNQVRYKVRRNNAECQENFRHLITYCPRLDFDSNNHVQYLYDNFSAKISKAYNHAFPFIEVKKKSQIFLNPI